MVKIRRATINDAGKMHSILNNTEELRGISEGEEYPLYWINGAIKDKKGFIILIIGEESEIYGFLIGRITPSVREAILVDIYIVPSQRKNGLATKLVKNFEEMVINEGYTWIASFIELENVKSQKLFEGLGYDKGNSFYFYRKVIN